MKIDIYSKPDCVYCNRAKDLFNQKGLQFNEHVVGSDITRDDFIIMFRGAKTVPQIVIDGKHIGGYDNLTEWVKTNDNASFLAG